MKRFLARGINQRFPKWYLYVLDKCTRNQLLIVSFKPFFSNNREVFLLRIFVYQMISTALPNKLQFLQKHQESNSKIHCHRLFLQMMENSNYFLFSFANTAETNYFTHLAFHSNSKCLYFYLGEVIN